MRDWVGGGRQGVEPDVRSCGRVGWGKGRGKGTERSLRVARCQKRRGNVKRTRHGRRRYLDVMALGGIQLLEKKVKELEARRSRGTASSSSIIKQSDCRALSLGRIWMLKGMGQNEKQSWTDLYI